MGVRTPVVPHVPPVSLRRISGFYRLFPAGCHCQVIAIPVHTKVAKFSSPYKGKKASPLVFHVVRSSCACDPLCLALFHQQLFPGQYCCLPSWLDTSRTGPFLLNSVPQSILIGFWVIFRQDLFSLETSPLMGAKERITNVWDTCRSSHLWGRWATLWPCPSCL